MSSGPSAGCVGTVQQCSEHNTLQECGNNTVRCYSLVYSESGNETVFYDEDATVQVMKGCATNEFPSCAADGRHCFSREEGSLCVQCCSSDSCNAGDPRKSLIMELDHSDSNEASDDPTIPFPGWSPHPRSALGSMNKTDRLERRGYAVTSSQAQHSTMPWTMLLTIGMAVLTSTHLAHC